jgi:hypothetical protein
MYKYTWNQRHAINNEALLVGIESPHASIITALQKYDYEMYNQS